jgi:homoserine O-succinyltransferase
VLHYDGIRRHPLREKKFGVFEAAMTSDHLLMTGLPRTIQFPHSRWNEIRQDELSPSGYFVLAKSEDAGVDSFVKKRDKSLFVHFQGHPEYGAETLLKEYRRDIKRFLRGERDNYPPMPRGYFDGTAFQVLERFRGVALSNRCEGVIDSFPESVLSGLNHPWQSSAIAVYRNWLGYLSSRKIEASTFVGFGRSRGSSHQAHNDVA